MAEIPYYLKKIDGSYLLLATGARIILGFTESNDVLQVDELDTAVNVSELEQPGIAELDTTINAIKQEPDQIEELDTTDNIWQP